MLDSKFIPTATAAAPAAHAATASREAAGVEVASRADALLLDDAGGATDNVGSVAAAADAVPIVVAV